MQPTRPPQRPLRGITLKILAVIVFIAMAALIKSVAQHVPAGQAVFFRSLFAIPVIVIWLALRRDQEAACDARVIACADAEERAAYALLIARFAADGGAGLETVVLGHRVRWFENRGRRKLGAARAGGGD